MASPIFMLDIDPVGVVATHPRHLELPALVAPVPEGDAPKSHNTLRARLLAIGCMRLFKEGFAFDSSLVSPLAERSFTRLAKLLLAIRKQDDADPKRFPPCSVFGHTDPTGEVGYNKTLSGRRARAVYAVLTRDTDIWDDLYQHAHGGDDWRHRGLQVMLRRLGFFSGDVTEQFGKNHSEVVSSDYYLKADNVVIEGMTNVTIKVGQSFVAIEAGGIKIGTTGKIVLDAKANVEVKGLAGVKVESPAQVQLQGTQTSVKGSAMVEVQGAIVKIN